MSLPARNPRFAKITSSHITTLQSLLTDGGKIVTEPTELAAFNRDWLNQRVGNAPCALLPQSTAEVKRILAFCNENKIAVVPQAGNTGLVYGSVPVHDEVVLSTKRINKILEVHPETYSATCDAGVILHDLHVAANKHEMIAPLDLGARGSCCIAGNVSTNAGGIHFARYGSMRSNTLGLRVVLANGTELDLMSSLRKDNTGFDLKQLFIGSEGKLGVITQCEVKLHPLSSAIRVAILVVPNFAHVLKLYHLAQRHLAEVLAAFEVIDVQGLSSVGKLEPCASEGNAAEAFKSPESFAVLVETRGANEEHDTVKLLDFLEMASSEGIATDTKIASTSAQNADLWKIREELPVHLAKSGTIFKFDLCFPLHEFNMSVDFCRELMKKRVPEEFARGEIVVTGFGHFGDGNVHLNIIVKKSAPKETVEKLKGFLKEEIYDFASKKGGSISAEHGIGEQKFDLLRKTKAPEVMAMMELMKKTLDPNGILNPYKVVDAFEN